jgi:hypothetical protein
MKASFLPEVEEAGQEDADEEGDLDPPGPPQAFKGDGPGKEKGRFHVKEKENKGDPVEEDGITKRGSSRREDAAFKGPKLFGSRSPFAESAGQKEEGADHPEDHEPIDREGKNPGGPRRQNHPFRYRFHSPLLNEPRPVLLTAYSLRPGRCRLLREGYPKRRGKEIG